MYVYCLVLLALWPVSCVDIELAGDVRVDVRVDVRGTGAWAPRGGAAGGAAGGARRPPGLRLRLDGNHDSTSKDACIYQLPKTKQVDAIMSNMMNVLTKVFTRTRELCDKAPQQRVRTLSTRFRVVRSKQSSYFDNIYSNMTEQFKTFCRRESGRLAVPRAGGACGRQAELRRLWRGVLAQAHAGLRRAAERLVRRHLQLAGRARAAPLKRVLGAYMSRELRRLRGRQLRALCGRRRRCYEGLS